MEEQKESITQFKNEYFTIAFHIIKPNEYEENQVFDDLEKASRNVLDKLSGLVKSKETGLNLEINEWRRKANYVIKGIQKRL